DREIGYVLAHEIQQLYGSTGLPDHGEAEPLEQARKPFAEENIVVRDHDAHQTNRGAVHGRVRLSIRHPLSSQYRGNGCWPYLETEASMVTARARPSARGRN